MVVVLLRYLSGVITFTRIGGGRGEKFDYIIDRWLRRLNGEAIPLSDYYNNAPVSFFDNLGSMAPRWPVKKKKKKNEMAKKTKKANRKKKK